MKNKLFLITCLMSFESYSNDDQLWDKVRGRGLPLNKNYNISSGTGFFIAPGYVLTNEHVVHDCLTISMRGAVAPTEAELVIADKTHDLALLKTNSMPNRIAQFRSNEGSKIEDYVFTVGYPLEHGKNGDYVLSQAKIISLDNQVEEADEIEFTASIEHGNSGGGLIDINGNIIGIVQAKKDYYHHLASSNIQDLTATEHPFKTTGVAIGLAPIKTFLSQNNINYNTGASYDMYANFQPDIQAKEYTVNIHCVNNVIN